MFRHSAEWTEEPAVRIQRKVATPQDMCSVGRLFSDFEDFVRKKIYGGGYMIPCFRFRGCFQTLKNLAVRKLEGMHDTLFSL